MSDLNRILNQLLSSGAASGFAGGLAGSMAGSLLSGKSGRKLGKKAIKYGGLAAVGALAYAAYKNYSDTSGKPGTPALSGAGQPALAPPPPGTAFLPAEADAPARNALGLTLVRAMIAAGRADGRLDSDESQAIFTRIQSLDLSPEEKNLLIAEMERPVDMDEIVRSAATPEVATEIYTASLLAIDVDDPAENAYLAMLAARLRLPADLVAEIHRQAESE
jgi:uncharacterized membrane protein YebE (DUF533 family)